jgi:hypothetical protein
MIAPLDHTAQRWRRQHLDLAADGKGYPSILDGAARQRSKA